MVSLRDMAEKLESRSGNPFVYPELGWEIVDDQLYKRYQIAVEGAYNPYTDIHWDRIVPHDFTEEERIAVRYFWSRQALFEYQLVLTIVRALEEAMTHGYPTEIKHLLMMHLRDEWWHVAMPTEYARRIGGVMRPLPGLLQKHKELYKERSNLIMKRIQPLFAEISATELTSGYALYVPLREAKDSVSAEIFSHIYTDEQRHGRSNWIWATRDLSPEERGLVENHIPQNLMRQTKFFGFGYLDLPRDEQEFHIECMKIAKDVGVTLWNADQYVKQLKEGLNTCRKLLDEVGLSADFSQLEDA